MKKVFYLSVILQLCAGLLFAQDSAPLTSRLSVLDNKAWFNFPKGAVNAATVKGLMAADANKREETRIMLESGSMKMIFYAKELYTLSNRPMFLLSLQQNDPAYAFKKKILTDKDSLISILSVPAKFDSSGDGVLVNSLLVQAQDHSVFRIDAFINREAYKNRLSYQRLSEKVFASLSKGTRRVDLLPRKELYPIMGSNKQFEITLPAGYAITRNTGPDFQVLQFHKYLAITDTVWLGLTIYTGNHPSYFYYDYRLEEAAAKKVKGSFAGKETEWLQFHSDKGFFLKEQQIPAGDIAPDLIIHVAVMSNSPSLMVEQEKIISFIKVTGK